MKGWPAWIFLSALFPGAVAGAADLGLKSFEATPEWIEGIRGLAPEKAAAVPLKERRLLVFSVATGFCHWCIPHTDAVVRVLGEKTGAYQAVRNDDIDEFEQPALGRYDAVVLNNNCPDGKNRDVFRDILVGKLEKFGAKYRDLPLAEREVKAARLYRNLVDFVAAGGGLIVLHGGIANFNNSEEFSALLGGSFNYHPKQQELALAPVEPDHPLLRPFAGKPFLHIDEPYMMKGAYAKMNFRPMLELDTARVEDPKRMEEIHSLPRYVSWIKRHGRGRVFYCSPSHNAQSFERPELLAYLLNGIQYALGDLACEDTPPSPKP